MSTIKLLEGISIGDVIQSKFDFHGQKNGTAIITSIDSSCNPRRVLLKCHIPNCESCTVAGWMILTKEWDIISKVVPLTDKEIESAVSFPPVDELERFIK